MEFIFSEILFVVIGWIYLFFKYRNFSKMNAIKDKEYGGEYSNVGKIKAFQAILVVFIVTLLLFLIGMVIGIFKS